MDDDCYEEDIKILAWFLVNVDRARRRETIYVHTGCPKKRGPLFNGPYIERFKSQLNENAGLLYRAVHSGHSNCK